MKKLNVIALPVDQGGCGYYRVRQPMRQLDRLDRVETHIIDNAVDSGEQVTRALAISDVCVVRQGGEEGMRQLRVMPEFKHLKWVLDIDDNIELISPYSQHYEEYGLEEFYDRVNKLWIWKDGQQRFDLARNRKRVNSLLAGMTEADLVTVTTPALADYARQFNPNVAILPNCIDHAQWWPLKMQPNEQLRIGWSGGVSHYEDWEAIRDPLNRMLRKHRFTLVTVGAGWPNLIDEDLRDLVEVWPWVPFPAHSYRMMCMALDAAIIPLADMPFNHYKSSIKWYEFSAMGVPSVVSNITPYKEEIEDGKTALGFTNPIEFEQKLEQLITDQALRQTIAGNALSWVKENRDAEKCASIWEEAYASLTS